MITTTLNEDRILGRFYKLACDEFLPIEPDVFVLLEKRYNSFRIAGIDDGMRRQLQWQKPRERRTKQQGYGTEYRHFQVDTATRELRHQG